MVGPPAGLNVQAIPGLPEIEAGADVAALAAPGLMRAGLTGEDVVAVAHKVISKAEGRIRSLREVEPGPHARALAERLAKDPRHVQVVLDESRAVLRAERGVLISVTHHGFVCANAGVDASNVPGEERVVLLPRDPDASARSVRHRLRELTGAAPAVIVTDSFGRAWRHGQCEVAIGCAGLAPLADWRGRTDYVGRELRATWIAVADQLAAAADLARSKDDRRPVILVRGAASHVTAEDGPGAQALIRPETEDLFR